MAAERQRPRTPPPPPPPQREATPPKSMEVATPSQASDTQQDDDADDTESVKEDRAQQKAAAQRRTLESLRMRRLTSCRDKFDEYVNRRFDAVEHDVYTLKQDVKKVQESQTDMQTILAQMQVTQTQIQNLLQRKFGQENGDRETGPTCNAP